MKAQLSLALLALLALENPSSVHAQGGDSVALETLPSFEASCDQSDVDLARPFELCIVGRYRKGTRILWPDTLGLGAGFEELERHVRFEALGPNLMSSELCVTLMLFDSQLREIPGIAVSYDLGTGEELVQQTSALPLRVNPSLAQDSILRAPAPPVQVLIRDWRLMAMVVGTIVCVGLLVGIWLLRRRWITSRLASMHARHQVELSPHEEALAKLAALEASGALDSDELKDCFLAMSEVFRSYLGRRFGFSALDLTSSEIRTRLASVPGAESWLTTVTTWLSRCDLVKYANTAADADEAREALYDARKLIARTKEAAQEATKEVASV